MSAALVRYFWQAQQHGVTTDKTLAYYPGQPSVYGARNDALEGVTRLMPLWAAYASSPHHDVALGQSMLQQLRLSLNHGTDPLHPGYWGSMDDKSTLICEGADVALAIWLSKDTLWRRLRVQEQQAVMQWLHQAIGKHTADNNWHLFVVLIDLVLSDLDPAHRFSSHDRLLRVREFYVSDGCFRDGPTGAVDFYNAWGFHYVLFWLHQLSAPLVADFAGEALSQYCRWYQLLFTSAGLPLFGRSLCYRFAAPGPLLSCAVLAPATVAPGVAVSAYLATWQYFVQQGGLRYGRPTQGVFADDPRWLDLYSGPASSFWGTRSMVLFYYVARQLDWRQVVPATLPAEEQNVDVTVDGLAARIQTNADLRESVVRFSGHHTPLPDITPRRAGTRHRLRQLVYATASRPENDLQRAGLGQFSSRLEMYR